MSNAWMNFVRYSLREIVMEEISEKRKADAKETDLMDWLLAIDASLT